MRHISTRNLVVKKMYGETTNHENELLNSESEKNWKLPEELEAFNEVKQKLESETYKPSNTSIRIIMEHSRKTAKEIAPSC